MISIKKYMLFRKNYDAFSLAEMMVVMLILSIVLAAATPIITKRVIARANETTTQASSVPVGTIIIWAAAVLPQGDDAGKWLECNGQSTVGYPELASIVGPNVPNYQGMFLRGQGSQTYSQNNGSTIGITPTTYSSSTLGTIQGDAIRNITGGWTAADNELASTLWGSFYGGTAIKGSDYGCQNDNWSAPGVFDISRVIPTASEIRPVNVAVKYLIKAKV